MTFLITLFAIVAVMVLAFGLVLAIDFNKGLNTQFNEEAGNWTRLKIRGEK